MKTSGRKALTCERGVNLRLAQVQASEFGEAASK